MKRYLVLFLFFFVILTLAGCWKASSSVDFIVIGRGVDVEFDNQEQSQLFREWYQNHYRQKGNSHIRINSRLFIICSLGRKEDAIYTLKDLEATQNDQTINITIHWAKTAKPQDTSNNQYPHVLLEIYKWHGKIKETTMNNIFH